MYIPFTRLSSRTPPSGLGPLPNSGRAASFLRGIPAAPVLLMVGALGTGAVAGRSPVLAVFGALGLAFVLLMTWDLAIGLCGFVLVAFLDVVSENSDVSVTRGVGLLLALSWFAAVAVRGRPRPNLFLSHPAFTLVLVVFVSWAGLSMLWAESPGVAQSATLRYGLNVLLVPIVYTAVSERRHVLWIFAVFILGADLSALYGQAMGTVGDQAGRLNGARQDANVLSTMLVVAFAFASTLALVVRRAPLLRLVALGAAGVALIGVFATFSRSGLLALTVALVVAIAFGGRWRVAPAALALVVAVSGVVYFSSSPASVGARVTSDSSSGRTDLWTVGWRMVQDHPVLGVGADNFAVVSVHYIVAPGAIASDEYIIDRPQVAHNTYLQVLADLGVVGFAMFISILAFCLGCTARAAALFRRHGDVQMEVIARALLIGLAGILGADLFLTEQFSKQLWLLLSVGPALLALARRPVLPELPR